MSHYENAMIERQAQIITDLRKQLAEANDHHQRRYARMESTYRDLAVYGNFYKQMQKIIVENPTLVEEWGRFCLLMKLTDPSADQIKKTEF